MNLSGMKSYLGKAIALLVLALLVIGAICLYRTEAGRPIAGKAADLPFSAISGLLPGYAAAPA